MTNRDKWFLAALLSVNGIGAQTVSRIHEEGLSFEQAWTEPAFLVERQLISASLADEIRRKACCLDPEGFMAELGDRDISLLTRWDQGYPQGLFHLHQIPAALYCRGDMSLLNKEMVAVVGSRGATVYGRRVAAMLGRELGEAGVTVVSGMARGIDSQAHIGALGTPGSTVAVLGCGVDVVYPSENQELYSRMVAEGLVISEFPPGTRPDPRHFPMRNRIIAALARDVVVVEARERSGALITVQHALELGREVWAVPGPITSPLSRGTNELLRDGARVLVSPADLVGTSMPGVLIGGTSGVSPEITLEEGSVLQYINDVPVQLEELGRITHIDMGTLSRILLTLELKGIITCIPGNHYVRNS